MSRPQGTAAVRVITPGPVDVGWSAAGHSVVEVVTDDMPFLVDSVTMELSRLEHNVHVVIHPRFEVTRDIAGGLQTVSTLADGVIEEAAPDALEESWMHVEIDRVVDEDEVAQIVESLQRVLRDVRESVEDWPKMCERAHAVVAEIESNPPPIEASEIKQSCDFIRWLADDHFTFIGYREYKLESVGDGDDEEWALRAIPGTGLGVLRADQDMSSSFAKLPTLVKDKAREKTLLVLAKANSRATVHRPAYLDYVGVKTFGENGEVVGERRFLGLYSSAAYTESVTRIPLLSEKASSVMRKVGFDPRSHAGKALMDTLENYPRDELFHTPAEELAPTVEAVMFARERRQPRLFARRDTYRRYVSVLIYLPRDRYNTTVRERFSEILTERLNGESVEFTARVNESTTASVHFVVHPPKGETIPDFDVADLERRMVEAARSWRDDFTNAVLAEYGEERGSRLARTWSGSFPEAYKEDFNPRTGAADLGRLEAIEGDEGIDLALFEQVDAGRGEARLKVFRVGAPLSLSEVLPMLSSMGVEVVDERPYELSRPGPRVLHLRVRPALRAPAAGHRPQALRRRPPRRVGGLQRDRRLQRARARRRPDVAPGDRAPRLREVHEAGQLAVRARLHRGRPAQQRRHHPAARRASSRHASTPARATCPATPRPVRRGSRSSRRSSPRPSTTWSASTTTASSGPTSPTSAARCAPTTSRPRQRRRAPRPYMSFKLEPSAIPDLPEPRPKFEIFVYSPRVEGVHLRFGAVARGGLRWSDRRDDFRTEVLGLVKAQMVKNTVIVPVGAKGGFFCKQLPDPADRDAWLAEGVACYTTFISGLLDITDNLVDGPEGSTVVPPTGVVRHDGDDTYLVVAADKGTATFSDIANGVAKDYGFWLGDAFASGGSVGYDHKAMGITARGAWVSVQRHFRERGIDCQTEDFTAVGIGDMSGDVFGNGMLCSEHTRLVAAFDHRDIFIDPDPDPAVSFAERKRLFELPRSSWQDYDKSLISSGGGVWARSLKSIPISAPVRRALGLADDVVKLTPAELMRAVLLAPVDLLWNGGIGTYVKSADEVNADAGDKANDAIRVNGEDLRAKCVGEGGNLGLTQLGRIEYAQLGCGGEGGRINTDFIDNSAGVDTSDHEVNIKILLDKVVAGGDMTNKQRNKLLAEMTDEVADLVLARQLRPEPRPGQRGGPRRTPPARARGLDEGPRAARGPQP